MQKKIFYDFYFAEQDNWFFSGDNYQKVIKKMLELEGLASTLREAREYLQSYKICEIECYLINSEDAFLQELGSKYLTKVLVSDIKLAESKEDCKKKIQELADDYARAIKELWQETLEKIEIKIDN